jgi:tripartite-type tricarboxylate transporter receptor subunit TctC
MPEMDNGALFGLLGPAKMPADVVAILAKACVKVLESREMRESLAGQTLFPAKNPGPQAMLALMQNDAKIWPPIIKKMNLGTAE